MANFTRFATFPIFSQFFVLIEYRCIGLCSFVNYNSVALPVSVFVALLSAFNWWEENCCIFLKKISSPNAFYLFLPLYKQQTTPYNVLFFKKMKKYVFSFSFQTGTGSQWEGPHNNNKATCIQPKFTIHYI